MRRQHASDLLRPLLPGGRAPEIVDPQEPALFQIRAEVLHLLVRQARRAHIFHEEHVAAGEQRIGQPDDDVVGLMGGVEPDAHERQLGEAD